MRKDNDAQKLVMVAGDVTVDWNLARSRSLHGGGSAWSADDCTYAYRQRGGAALLADLIGATAARLNNDQIVWDVRRAAQTDEQVHPGDARYHHSYAMWSLFAYGENPPHARERPAWRVEEFLGLDRCRAGGDAATRSQDGAPPDARIVVLDDADLGFRDRRESWPRALTASEARPWVLLKMARPVARGALWEHLHATHAERLVVVMTVNDLRLTEVQISRELSWERTAQDLAWELRHNPQVNALSNCAFVVVSFNTAGAILCSHSRAGGRTAYDSEPWECSLFFDPGVVEGMWEQQHRGGMIGYSSCLAAGITRQLMLSPERPDIEQGIQGGLAAMRKLHLEGYGERGSSVPDARLSFPVELIADELARESKTFAVVKVQNPVRFLTSPTQAKDGHASPAGFWTILEDRYADSLDELARRIALEGVETALEGVPLGHFRNLLTVDRREIESFRSIRTLIQEYCRQERQKRPLSFAVFGPPGSGKSFGVTEVANSLLPGRIKVLEFNLSQFGAPQELLGALHQVRDVGLTGLVPLVFWDEFDSALAGRELGWLRYFLAPMQDGSFQEGQITHPVGRSIFVFAGGTSTTMTHFDRGSGDTQFRAAKGPDFVSRLKGYINILGPNRQKKTGADEADTNDPYFVVRRAILLRSMLQRAAPQLFRKRGGRQTLDIDAGVLRAFLGTREYKHGARSMEAIIAMSQLVGKGRFERSCLPAEAQLDLHVDGRDFLALVQQIELEGELLERLAEAAHEVYCEGKRRDGWKYGETKSEVEKTHPLLVPYAELPKAYKESNRTTVRLIPRKLEAASYLMIPSRSDDPPLEFPGEDLETLAQLEHQLWMEARLADGWERGKPSDDHPKRNEYLTGWENLPDAIKQIDRDLIRGIPRILAEAGYAVVKIRARDGER